MSMKKSATENSIINFPFIYPADLFIMSTLQSADLMYLNVRCFTYNNIVHHNKHVALIISDIIRV